VNRKDYTLAALSGTLLSLAFPLFDLEPLAWIGLVPLFSSLRGKNPLQSTYLGLISGLFFNTILLYWIPVPVTVYGKLPLPVGILLLLALASYLSIYSGAFAFLTTFIRARTGLPLVLIAPAAWVSLEILMTYLFTGFPWGVLGYSQHLTLPVIQIADITGVYGVSFLIVMVNAGIYRAIERYGEGLPFLGGRSIWVALFVFLSTMGYGYWRLDYWENPPIPPLAKGGQEGFDKNLRIGIVQGNIDQDHKWDPEYQKETMDAYLGLSGEVSKGGVDLVVWPETAVPFYFQDDEINRPKVLRMARETGSHILFGSPAYERGGEGVRYYNRAYLVSPEMKVAGKYDKLHLVPFGEYVPLKNILFFVSKLTEGIGDFSAGIGVEVLDMPGARIGTLICYEGVFPNLARRSVREGANILVNITNDAWFGRTSAPFQHLSMYTLRAVENRVPVVRAANTGVSAFIDSGGMVTSKTGLFERGYLKGKVKASNQKTFYTRFGDIFSYLCLLITSLFLSKAFMRK
jgi:apolipoprotein N-acyltransferase